MTENQLIYLEGMRTLQRAHSAKCGLFCDWLDGHLREVITRLSMAEIREVISVLDKDT